LKQKGFSKVNQPKNVNIALNRLYLNQVSIITSDWKMPDMDGLEFHKRAKREGLLDGAPFLIVSTVSERGRVT
jgi:CheY-like chemotaxis protein